jgi:hypothetical protein
MWRQYRPTRPLADARRQGLPADPLCDGLLELAHLYIAISGVAFFSTISFFRLTLPAMLRLTRRVLVGRVRTAVPVWNRRRLA